VAQPEIAALVFDLARDAAHVCQIRGDFLKHGKARELQNSNYQIVMRASPGKIPTINSTESNSSSYEWENVIKDIYAQNQILHIRNAAAWHNKNQKGMFDYSDICHLQARKASMISETFCVENPEHQSKPLSASQVFGGPKQRPSASWYSSFLVQHDAAALKDTMKKLPFACPPVLRSKEVHHSDHVWIFVGDNRKRKPMPGRPEHTDAVAHAGTWHYQLSGSKVHLP